MQQIERLVSEVESAFDQTIDILVNNAGHFIARVPNMEMTEEHYRKVMDANLKRVVFMSKAAVKGMIEKGKGKIINVTSIAAHNEAVPEQHCMRLPKPWR